MPSPSLCSGFWGGFLGWSRVNVGLASRKKDWSRLGLTLSYFVVIFYGEENKNTLCSNICLPHLKYPTFNILNKKKNAHTLVSNISKNTYPMEINFISNLISIQFSEAYCNGNTDAMPCG